ncbi:MAG TPA: aminoglycoside phosphotransferase family protein [Rhizomicrobium sp.]|jgi:aminoglycoside phosphotransferase (APT) family kinase protein|nr:aminoglycoside phosphotransferase family protein [Rhizomicrobium sp.]
MPLSRLHADEIEVDAVLVERLVAAQFPQWAHLPVAAIALSGTDHAIYRLGPSLSVRLPRRPEAVKQVEKEQRFLPALAPPLPLAIPTPLALGAPGEGYPWPWSVYRWLEGETPAQCTEDLARDLGGFIAALRRIDARDGPRPGRHNFGRGMPLATRDGATREAIAALSDVFDAAALTAIWEAGLNAPAWEGAPVWIHGDLSAGNLLMVEGRLSAVIDFGGLAAGDPACDLIAAWSLFAGAERDAFRAVLMPDDASWARGRGWALSVGTIGLAYYRASDGAIAANMRRTIAAVLADCGQATA